MTTAITVAKSGIAEFKLGVDNLLEKRIYFKSKIEPMLTEGTDFYIIKGKKSLGKAGAEKLASIYGLTASFKKDTETLDSFQGAENIVAFVCFLSHQGEVVGEGRGAASLMNNGGDYNRTIKMSEKSAYISAVIRSVGLSDIFTQDLESMSAERVQTPNKAAPVITMAEIFPDDSNGDSGDQNIPYEPNLGNSGADMITAKQKKFLENLAYERIADNDDREKFLASIGSMSKADASEEISSFLQAAEQR